MVAAYNPYVGLPHAQLCGLRKDYAKMLHAAVSARKAADRQLQLIVEALHQEQEPRDFEASDHAVIRYLERVQGVDVNAIRDTITFNCATGKELIGDKLRGQDGFLYCLNGDGHVTTILPLGAVIDEALAGAEAASRGQPSARDRRRARAKRDFAASGTEARRAETTGSVHDGPTAESGDAHKPNGGTQ